MNINLQNYPDICPCLSPARILTGSYDGIKTFSWHVCVNPSCMFFDQEIPRQRELAEAAVRQTSAYRRKILWKPEIRRHNRQQRKLRAAVNKIPLRQQV